jgi:hypothetical protein
MLMNNYRFPRLGILVYQTPVIEFPARACVLPAQPDGATGVI